MSWKSYPYQDFAAPFMRRRGGLLGRMIRAGRGMRGMRGMRMRRSRSFFCCCPVFLALGVAALGAIGGLFYLGIRFLGWA